MVISWHVCDRKLRHDLTVLFPQQILHNLVRLSSNSVCLYYEYSWNNTQACSLWDLLKGRVVPETSVTNEEVEAVGLAIQQELMNAYAMVQSLRTAYER